MSDYTHMQSIAQRDKQPNIVCVYENLLLILSTSSKLTKKALMKHVCLLCNTVRLITFKYAKHDWLLFRVMRSILSV